MKAKTKVALWLNTTEENIKDFQLWDNVIFVTLHKGRPVFVSRPILSCKFLVAYLRELGYGEGWQRKSTKENIQRICKKHARLEKQCKKDDLNLRSDYSGWTILDRQTNKILKYDNFTM